VIEVRLEKTCNACPEQYDAFIGDERVGYLRLRHGYFSVSCPYHFGEVVFSSESCEGDGEFSEHEREGFLSLAKEAIAKWYIEKEQPRDE